MGSIISLIATSRRNRVQSVLYHKETIPFVNRDIGGSAAQAEILIKLKGEESSFTNLTLGRVTIENTTNTDYEEFQFGITLSDLSMAVYLQTRSQDRYHEIHSNPEIDLRHLDNKIDFRVKPFNRKDIYSVTLFISPMSDDKFVDIELNTKHPIKFTNADEVRDVFGWLRIGLLATTILVFTFMLIVVIAYRTILFTLRDAFLVVTVFLTALGTIGGILAIPSRRI